ncbi:hypothetical protein ACEPAI_1431 [Sanghuangporus weigelae]
MDAFSSSTPSDGRPVFCAAHWCTFNSSCRMYGLAARYGWRLPVDYKDPEVDSNIGCSILRKLSEIDYPEMKLNSMPFLALLAAVRAREAQLDVNTPQAPSSASLLFTWNGDVPDYFVTSVLSSS